MKQRAHTLGEPRGFYGNLEVMTTPHHINQSDHQVAVPGSDRLHIKNQALSRSKTRRHLIKVLGIQCARIGHHPVALKAELPEKVVSRFKLPSWMGHFLRWGRSGVTAMIHKDFGHRATTPKPQAKEFSYSAL